VKTSYLPSEIRWGERLVPLIAFHKDDGRYCIDFTHFDDTEPVDPPMSERSAKDSHERRTDRHVDASEYPGSFTSSTMVRSISFPSQPSRRVAFPLVGKRKASQKVRTSGRPAKSQANVDRVPPVRRSSSCMEILQTAPSRLAPASPTITEPLRSRPRSVTLEEPSTRWRTRSQGSDDAESGLSSPLRQLTDAFTDDGGGSVRFQLEEVAEDDLADV